MITLRDYQQALEDGIYRSWQAGNRNVLAVLPTGGGKTRVKASIFHKSREPSTAIAHRQELVGQISMALADTGTYHRIIAPDSVIRFCIGQHVRKHGHAFHHASAPVAVGGVDTIIARADSLTQWCNQNKIWDIDEAHHVLRENKWGKAVAMFPNAWGVGFTATPLRADRKSLGAGRSGVFHDMIVGPSMRELIRRGYLADYRIFAPPGSIDVSQIGTSDATGDYNQTALRREAHKSTVTGDVVDHYLRFAPGKRGITFAVDVELATATAEAFRARGVTAEVVSAKTPDIVRSSVIERFAAGSVLQLVNVDLFGEGFDVPACEVVSMARPTKSYGLYVQQFGRALRPFTGKTHGIILDHVENVKRHGFPDKPRVWDIEADETKRASRPTDDMIPITCCVACFFPYERLTKTCPHCGHVDEPVSRGAPEYVDGDLVEFSPELLAKLRGDADAVQQSPYTEHLPNQAAVLRYRRLHSERAEAQRVLRETIDYWAGVEHANHDYSHSALYRLFYHTFGIDVLSAQSLNTQDTVKLTALIRERLT